ncbi:ATP-binding protein [Frankia torreyi]|uniref:ATP-binding protein n=1 Tax=Frankia torreyi TaxID=1856 RepID=UPI003BB728A1
MLTAARTDAGPVLVSASTLNRHAFVCGATGSGKSQTVRWLLENLSTGRDRQVPWLVIEPAKAEYARMAGRLSAGAAPLLIRPGELDVPPAGLNPMEPEPDFPLQSHIDLLRALFLAAFEAEEPFPQVLSLAMTRVYADAGFNLVTGHAGPSSSKTDRRPRYPTLRELQAAASRVVDEIGYGPETEADVRGFIDIRIGSLREGTSGRFFEGGHPLDIGRLRDRDVILELEDLTNDQDKAFLMGTVILRIVEHLRVKYGRGGPGELQHVMVIEEAHRLLKNAPDGPAAAAVELFATLLAEIRAYGEGVAVVEQIPAKVIPDVVKNSALKVMHRLPGADDRAFVGAAMNLQPEQSEQVVALPPGEAAVTVDGMDFPVLVRVPFGEEREKRDGASGADPPLVASRSRLCPAECLRLPCTLRQIDAANGLAKTPVVTTWTEAAVVAHLVGRNAVGPSPRVRQTLGKFAGQAPLVCALVSAVDRAVDARRALLRTWVDPDAFADHILAVLRGQLATEPADPFGRGRVDRCDASRWAGGPYRWSDVLQTLRAEPPDAPRHPSTDEWTRRGLWIDAPTAARQLALLLTAPEYGEGGDDVLVGDTAASGLLAATAALASGPTLERQISAAFEAACPRPINGDLGYLVAGAARDIERRRTGQTDLGGA